MYILFERQEDRMRSKQQTVNRNVTSFNPKMSHAISSKRYVIYILSSFIYQKGNINSKLHLDSFIRNVRKCLKMYKYNIRFGREENIWENRQVMICKLAIAPCCKGRPIGRS